LPTHCPLVAHPSACNVLALDFSTTSIECGFNCKIP
jgi:hypothetical protein